MQAEPRVSVIMSFFNAEPYIQEAIESVMAQTYDAWELLLVDDGSADGSTEIALRYVKARPERIRYLSHPGRRNMGASASRNLGLAFAQGEYAAILDADDIAEPARLEEQTAFLDTHHEVALLGSWYIEIDSNGRQIRESTKPCNDIDIRWALLFYCPFLHSSVMLRRLSILEKVGGYNESLRTSEDYELWQRIARQFRTANLDVPLVRYRIHDKSLTATVGRTSKKGAQLRTAGAARLLGWNEGPTVNAKRLDAMAALLLGWGNDITLENLLQASEDIFRLHIMFCSEEQLEFEEAGRHRAHLRRLVSSNLIVLADSAGENDPSAVRSLLSRAYRVSWQTLLRPGLLMRACRLIIRARGGFL